MSVFLETLPHVTHPCAVAALLRHSAQAETHHCVDSIVAFLLAEQKALQLVLIKEGTRRSKKLYQYHVASQ